jgi:hypothetical protein
MGGVRNLYSTRGREWHGPFALRGGNFLLHALSPLSTVSCHAQVALLRRLTQNRPALSSPTPSHHLAPPREEENRKRSWVKRRSRREKKEEKEKKERKNKGKEKRKEKKKRHKKNRNCDSQIILSILLLGNENRW